MTLRRYAGTNGNGYKVMFGIFVTLLTGLFFYFLQGNATDHREFRRSDSVVKSRVDQMDPAVKEELKLIRETELKQIKEQLTRIENEQRAMGLLLARKGIQ